MCLTSYCTLCRSASRSGQSDGRRTPHTEEPYHGKEDSEEDREEGLDQKGWREEDQEVGLGLALFRQVMGGLTADRARAPPGSRTRELLRNSEIGRL